MQDGIYFYVVINIDSEGEVGSGYIDKSKDTPEEEEGGFSTAIWFLVLVLAMVLAFILAVILY